MKQSIYLEALDEIKNNSGTSGAHALAKCILSLYDNQNFFSMGEILIPLDENYTKIALAMVQEYSKYGEDEYLVTAGREVYNSFPYLVELSDAMKEARNALFHKWDCERQEKENEEE